MLRCGMARPAGAPGEWYWPRVRGFSRVAFMGLPRVLIPFDEGDLPEIIVDPDGRFHRPMIITDNGPTYERVSRVYFMPPGAAGVGDSQEEARAYELGRRDQRTACGKEHP